MRVIKSCQSDLARDRPKRKILAKVVLQQPGRVPVTTGLAPPADIFTLHFIQAFRYSYSNSEPRTSKFPQPDLLQPPSNDRWKYEKSGSLFFNFVIGQN